MEQKRPPSAATHAGAGGGLTEEAGATTAREHAVNVLAAVLGLLTATVGFCHAGACGMCICMGMPLTAGPEVQVYARTAYRTVSGGDNGELVTAAYHLVCCRRRTGLCGCACARCARDSTLHACVLIGLCMCLRVHRPTRTVGLWKRMHVHALKKKSVHGTATIRAVLHPVGTYRCRAISGRHLSVPPSTQTACIGDTYIGDYTRMYIHTHVCVCVCVCVRARCCVSFSRPDFG